MSIRRNASPRAHTTAGFPLLVLVAINILASCGTPRDPGGTASFKSSLVDGREFEVVVPESGAEMQQRSAVVGEEGGYFATVESALSQGCDRVNGRASAVRDRLSDRRYLGDTVDASAHSLCMGHEWMNLATAVNPVDFYADGSFETRPALDPNESPSEQAERIGQLRGLSLVLPVPSSDSAATFAYLAVRAFQEAALTSAEILELAPAGTLEARVVAGAAAGSGLSDDASETTRLADVVVFQVAEGTQRLIEASRLAADLTSRVAQARNAARSDRERARYESWMGQHNSRFEIVGLWTGRPDCSCCALGDERCVAAGVDPAICYDPNWCARPDDDPPPRSEDCSCCEIDPETCLTASMCDPAFDICVNEEPPPGDDPRDPTDDPGDFTCDPLADSEEDAVHIVAQLGRLPDSASVPTRIIEELAARVREVEPATATLSDREALESTYGISADAFVRAVRHTHQRIQTLGLPVVPRGDGTQSVDGLSAVPSDEQLAAYTAARTIGENYFDYQAALAEEGDYRVSGGSGWSPFNHHFVPFAYGRQGVLPALTVIAASLRKGLGRSELAPERIVPGRLEQDPSRRLAHTAMQLARQFVPQFLKLNVGFGNDYGVERFQLRCYGCEGDESDYEIFVGEAGLHCATTGSVAGHACDEADYRVGVTPNRIAEGSINGFSDSFVEFFALSSQMPSHALDHGRIAPKHFYLTKRDARGRHVVSTFTPLQGPNGAGFTRTTYIPVVGQGIQIAGAAAIPSANECEDPRLCCDDLPCDPQLPRESELISDRYGTNSYESIDEALRNLALQLTTEADNLGREAIERQLSADQSAEAARGALEQLCGGVVNVETLGPRQCMGPGDCGPNGSCAANECLYESLADGIAALSGPDTSSIEECLGGELTNVSFGSDSLCYFQAVNDAGERVLPPCVCRDGDADCPLCPVQGVCSIERFGPLSEENYIAEGTLTMGTVDSVVAPEPTTCEDFAVLRSSSDEGTRVAAAERILEDNWLSNLTFRTLGERIGYTPELFQMGRVTFDGRSWLQTGSEAFGPTESDQFPCHAHPSVDFLVASSIDAQIACDEIQSDWSYGPPLLCGVEQMVFGGCSDHRNRIRLNARMRHAATLIAVLGGGSGRYLYTPGFKERDTTRGFEISRDLWDTVSAGPYDLDGVGTNWAWTANAGDARAYRRFGDVMLLRRCQNGYDASTGESCSDSAPPALFYPEGNLPDWLTTPVSGQIMGTLDPGGTAHGLGGPFAFDGNHYTSAGTPVGDPTFVHPDFWDAVADPEAAISSRCVRLDSAVPGTESLAAEETGALCPTMFAAVPASFEALGRARTAGTTIADFWSHSSLSEDQYTLRDFLMQVAHRIGSRWAPVPMEFDELPQGAAPYGRVLDALELACLAHQEDRGAGCGIDVSSVPSVSGPEGFAALERSLECAADSLEYGIQNATLFGVPASIADDIGSESLSTTFPEVRGDYAVAVNSLRSSAETITMATNQMASAMRQMSSGIAIARHQLKVLDLELEIAKLNSIAASLAAAAEAAQAVSSASLDWKKIGTGANIAEAVNLTAQLGAQAAAMVAAIQGFNLQEDIADEQASIVVLELLQQFGTHMDSIASASNLAVQGYAQIQQATTQLESIRQRAASQAMVILGQTRDPITGRENNFLQGQRRWTDLFLQRYESAWRRARRTAWYARHALEARIGLDLSEIDHDLSLVEAPAGWADALCEMKPLDYTELRDVAGDAEQPEPFRNGFLGDYMRLLGLVKDSYAFDYAYQNEPDTMILSMRDEVFDEVVQCDIEGHNLLHHAADPSTMRVDGVGGWIPDFEESGYAIATSPIPDSPFASFALADGTVVSRALGGAVAQRTYLVEPVGEPEPLSMQPGWRQSVELPAGRFVLSWSERVGEFDDATCASLSPLAPSLGASFAGHDHDLTLPATASFVAVEDAPNSHPCWRRVRVVVENPVAQWVDVSFHVDAVWLAGNPPPSIDWAAPQLEIASQLVNASDVLPTVFFPTDDDLAFPIGLCEDSTGAALRQHFSYTCEALCPPEFGDNCDAGEYCYWESNFALNVDALMRGEGGQFGGIAARSYNHRLQSVAVNLVGTNVRDCERSPRPSVCYASGFLPYSLRADRGTIRNHYGENVTPPYDPANVEFAKALSAERYITNPLSTADSTLLSSYWRRSFHGYPLSALYRLRIIDVPELDWEAVRDIQLVLQHTFFTHQR